MPSLLVVTEKLKLVLLHIHERLRLLVLISLVQQL